ncbi:sulfite exporter TauE/SafE family protein [Paraphotobacterium marinum]
MESILIICLVGLMSGFTTVLFGFGGGFIMVPFIYHFLWFSDPSLHQESMLIAIATSSSIMMMSSVFATYKNYQLKIMNVSMIFPLFYYIGIGALVGSFLSTIILDQILKLLFVLYLIVTIIDCLFRKGFIEIQPLNQKTNHSSFFKGIFIGCISSMLGVGGSIMTVPLLRREGFEIKKCVQAANALTIPVAITGCCMYCFLGLKHHLGSNYVGYINITCFIWVTLSSFSGIYLIKRANIQIPDKAHSIIYIMLLVLVTLVMIV